MITKLSVNNFRSIKDVSVDLSEVNVLIGANGAGKSTLIEALNFIKGVVAGNPIASVARNYAPFGHDFFNFYSEELSSKFSIDVQTAEDERFTYSFTIGYNPSDTSADEFFVISENLTKLSSEGENTNIFSRSSKSNTISLDSDDRISSDLPIKIDVSRLVLATISEDEVKKVVDTIISYEVIWFDDRFGQNLPSKMIVDDAKSLQSIDDLAVSLSIKDPARYDEAIETIKKIIPEFQKPRIRDLSENLTTSNKADTKTSDRKDQKGHRYFVTWFDARYDNSFTRFSISGGNLRTIFLILSLYNIESKSCFIAEEVENGMHPSRILKVVQIILQIAKKRQIQLIFSTHNYLLTSEVLPREIIFCTYKKGCGSAYKRLNDTDEFKTIKQALEGEPSTNDILQSGMLFKS